MPRKPSTNVGLIAMSLGAAVAAGGSVVLRLGSVPGQVLGVSLSSVLGIGLCAFGGLTAVGGLGLAALGPRRPVLAGTMLGAVGIDVLFLLGALTSNPDLATTPMANMLFGVSGAMLVACAGFWRGDVVRDPAVPPETGAGSWRFPAWSAPFVGGLVGAWLGLMAVGPSLAILVGVALGIVAGLVVYARHRQPPVSSGDPSVEP